MKKLNTGSSAVDMSNSNLLKDELRRRKASAEGTKDFQCRPVDFFPPELRPVYIVDVQNKKNCINVGKHYHNCFWHRSICS